MKFKDSIFDSFEKLSTVSVDRDRFNKREHTIWFSAEKKNNNFKKNYCFSD